MAEIQDKVAIQRDAEATRELIFCIAQVLVDDRDSLELNALVEDGCILLSLSVAPEDLKKLIGREGRVVRSIRTILCAAGMKQQRRYSLDIRERAG